LAEVGRLMVRTRSSIIARPRCVWLELVPPCVDCVVDCGGVISLYCGLLTIRGMPRTSLSPPLSSPRAGQTNTAAASKKARTAQRGAPCRPKQAGIRSLSLPGRTWPLRRTVNRRPIAFRTNPPIRSMMTRRAARPGRLAVPAARRPLRANHSHERQQRGADGGWCPSWSPAWNNRHVRQSFAIPKSRSSPPATKWSPAANKVV
jgi:hypothetical protein